MSHIMFFVPWLDSICGHTFSFLKVTAFLNTILFFFVCRNVHFVYLTFCGYFTYIRELFPQMNICSLQLKKAMKKVYALS